MVVFIYSSSTGWCQGSSQGHFIDQVVVGQKSVVGGLLEGIARETGGEAYAYDATVHVTLKNIDRPLWLGCTFIRPSGREDDLEAVRIGPDTDSHRFSYKVPLDGEYTVVVAVWRGTREDRSHPYGYKMVDRLDDYRETLSLLHTREPGFDD